MGINYSIIRSFAKLSNKVFSPKLSNCIVAFLLIPSISIFWTDPKPNFGCSTFMPAAKLLVLDGLKSGLGVWTFAVAIGLTLGFLSPTKPDLPSLPSFRKAPAMEEDSFLLTRIHMGSTSSKNRLGSQFSNLPNL